MARLERHAKNHEINREKCHKSKDAGFNKDSQRNICLIHFFTDVNADSKDRVFLELGHPVIEKVQSPPDVLFLRVEAGCVMLVRGGEKKPADQDNGNRDGHCAAEVAPIASEYQYDRDA